MSFAKSLTKAIAGTLIVVLLGYVGIASARYVSSDPVGLQGGMNTYAYVHNNPLRYVDPTGLSEMLGSPGWSDFKQSPVSTTFTVTQKGICPPGDPMCPIAMRAAGISGPYYTVKKTYSKKCVLSLGLAIKVPATVVGNLVISNAPELAAKTGAGPRVIAVARGTATVWNNPITMGLGAGIAINEVLEQCEVKHSLCAWTIKNYENFR